MNPVGPLNPRIYWLRRVSVIVAAVIVLIGIGYLVVHKAKKPSNSASTTAAAVSASPTPTLTGVLASRSPVVPPVSVAARSALSSSVPASSQAPKTSAAVVTKTVTSTKGPTSTPKSTPSATTPKSTPVATTPKSTSVATTRKSTPVATTPRTTAKPTSTPPPAPSTDAQGRLLCADASLKLQATTGAPSFALGIQPLLGVSVTNISSVACTRDLSGGLQVFTVYSAAGARIWSTADCFPGTGTDVRTLSPGQGVQYNITWSGTTSNPGCTAARTQAPVGPYQVRVQIGSLQASPANFSIA